LHLKSSIMRTQGTKEQRMAVMDTPRESMKKVMEALDILGGTSWRIRAPILDVVEKMWADGGGLANLVDANDVSIIMICRFSNSFLSSDSTILEMLSLTGNLHV
jgi:DNA-directed RNA polymerase